MPPKRKKYKIVKVSLGYEPQFRPPVFEHVSRLYMELLENKSKIKEGLRKLEFESKQFGGSIAPSIDVAHTEAINDVNKDINESEEGMPSTTQVTSSPRIHDSHTETKLRNEQSENKFIKTYQESKEYSPPGSRSVEKTWDETNNKLRLSSSNDSNSQDEYKAGMFKSLLQPKSSNKFIIGDEEEPLFSSTPKSASSSPTRTNPDGDSLSKIMRGEISDEEQENLSSVGLSSLNASIAVSSTKESYGVSAPKVISQSSSNPPPVKEQGRVIPSLEAISKNQVPLMSGGDVSSGPNVANMSYTGTEKDLQRKRDLLYKFKILKRQYTNGFVPEVNEYMDLHDLEREYDSVTRQLRLDEQVENYKKFLTMGFFGLEMVLKTFLKFQDIEGFASQQIAGMNQYEKILLEIGEKHSVSLSSQWPPELRLAGMVFMNAAVFLGTKMLFKGGSSGIMSSLFGGGSSSSSKPSSNSVPTFSSTSAPKKKMRGPDLDIEDLDAKKIN